MKGVILLNAYDRNPAHSRKARRMTDEFGRLGVTVSTVANDAFTSYIVGGNAVCDLDADFVLFFDKDRYTAQLIEKCGIPVFNSAASIALCDDKMLTHIALSDCGIPMPDTLPGALCYSPEFTVSQSYADEAIARLGLPLVVKQCCGSLGEQVYLARTRQQLIETIGKVAPKGYLLQRYEAQCCGKDMRVIVIGGKPVCAMTRSNPDDFRSNIANGGTAAACDIPDDVADMCVKAANILGLDYCGVDVLQSDVPKICEVNSNAMFEAMERVTGVNVAGIYARHIVGKVERGNGRFAHHTLRKW